MITSVRRPSNHLFVRYSLLDSYTHSLYFVFWIFFINTIYAIQTLFHLLYHAINSFPGSLHLLSFQQILGSIFSRLLLSRISGSPWFILHLGAPRMRSLFFLNLFRL
jgi:hypothetical protein